MPSPRTTIKNAVIAAIKAASSIASTRVYKGRHNVVAGGTSWPAVYVWMLRDDVDTDTLDRPRHRLNSMTLVTDYYAKAATPDALEDAFDTAVDAISDAVCVTSIAGTAGQDIILTSSEFLYEGGEEQPFGCARLTFTVKYFSSEPS